MLAVGVICSFATGMAYPLSLIIFDAVVNGFVSRSSVSSALDTMNEKVKWYILIGFLTLGIAFVQMFCFSLSAKRQSQRIRLKLFKVVLFRFLILYLAYKAYRKKLHFFRLFDMLTY